MVIGGRKLEFSIGVMPTMKKIGVDGCKAGWLAAVKDSTGKVRLEVYPTIGELWKAHKDADCIAIDIPIGLKDGAPHKRLCDVEARRLLGKKRASSVFSAPIREACYAENDEEAKTISKKKTGGSLTLQTLAIIPKIREVDRLLQIETFARRVFKEIHPEVCFWALVGGKPMAFKKRASGERGKRERIDALCPFLLSVESVLIKGVDQWTGKAKYDDILDALAALVTIDGEEGSLRTLPGTPEIDSTGLPMSMAYRLP